MSKLIKIDDNYAGWIKDLSLRFRQSQIKAAVKVNSEMLRFYFSLGADIVTKQAESKWGDGFFRNLSMDLQAALPGVKGFSIQSLYYAKRFYLLYTQPHTNFPQLGGKLQGKDLSTKLPQAGAEISKFPQLGGKIENRPQDMDYLGY